VRFIAVLGNAVGAGSYYLDCLVSRFLFSIWYLVTKSDLRCFVALAGILPAISLYVLVGLTSITFVSSRACLSVVIFSLSGVC